MVKTTPAPNVTQGIILQLKQNINVNMSISKIEIELSRYRHYFVVLDFSI